jgi:hypothetical protein
VTEARGANSARLDLAMLDPGPPGYKTEESVSWTEMSMDSHSALSLGRLRLVMDGPWFAGDSLFPAGLTYADLEVAAARPRRRKVKPLAEVPLTAEGGTRA